MSLWTNVSTRQQSVGQERQQPPLGGRAPSHLPSPLHSLWSHSLWLLVDSDNPQSMSWDPIATVLKTQDISLSWEQYEISK